MILLGFVSGKFSRREQSPEKKPVPQLPADKIRVLSLPPQACRLSERFFHDRRRVHEHFDFATELPIQEPAPQTLQPLLYDLVIVAIPRVDGDRRSIRSIDRLQRIRIRSIRFGQHDHGPRFRPKRRRIAAPLLSPRHPVHLPVKVGIQKLFKTTSRLRYVIRPAYADGIESLGECLLFEFRRQRRQKSRSV